MALSSEALDFFWSLVIAAFSGEKIEYDSFLEARKLGAFGSLSQQLKDPKALMAGEDCQFPGHSHTNREHIQEIVRDYWHNSSMKDPFEPGISGEESFKRRRNRDKIYPKWDGLVPGETSPDKHFNESEVRAIREFGKRLVRNDEQVWLERLIDPTIWAIGDVKLISDSNKVNDAQGGHRNALAFGEEFKDAKDLGIYGPWKSPWKEEPGLVDALRNNWSKVWGVRNAQNARNADLYKEADSARKAVSHFSAEDNSVKNKTFDFAVAHGDITEYIRLSPNYDEGSGWVIIPNGIQPNQRAHIESNIAKLTSDSVTRDIALVSGRSIEEIATLREVFFRSKDMADRLSGGLGVNWNDAWDYMTEARILIDKILAPSNAGQLGKQSLEALDRTGHAFADFRVDLPGKMFDMRFTSLLIFFLATGTSMLLGMWLFQNSNAGWSLVIGVVASLLFNSAIGGAVKQEQRRFMYILLGVLAFMVIAVPYAARQNGDRIQNDLQNDLNYRNSQVK